jgi:putative transposase
MAAAASAEKSLALPTIWEVDDELWARLEPIIVAKLPPASTGRPRGDLRRVLNGIIHRMRSGCQWNHLPREFGSDTTVHRWFQAFVAAGVFEELWRVLAEECEELGGLDWTWQSADGVMGKSRFEGQKRGAIPPTGANRAQRRA